MSDGMGDPIARCANCGTPTVPGFGTCAVCGRLALAQPGTAPATPQASPRQSGTMPPPQPLPPPQALPPAWNASAWNPSAPSPQPAPGQWTAPSPAHLPPPVPADSWSSTTDAPKPHYVPTPPSTGWYNSAFSRYEPRSARVGRAGKGYAGALAALGVVAMVVVIAAVSAAAGSGVARPSPTPPPGFRLTGSMSVSRDFATATTLADGRVLIAGGDNVTSDVSVTARTSAELYDAVTGRFTPTGSMAYAREFHTATLLKDGRVLIAGGATSRSVLGTTTNTAELYDPATGRFTETGSMAVHRNSHTATLLPDGTVLIAGGTDAAYDLMSAETYDPATGQFTQIDPMGTYRDGHTATTLADGRVVLIGGHRRASAEIFRPDAGSFVQTRGSMSVVRRIGTATLLKDGRVLVAGGMTDDSTKQASAELFDPATGEFEMTGKMADARSYFTATLLGNGQVLIVGGYTGSEWLDSAELYDPTSGTFTEADWMAHSRSGHCAALLHDGMVLIIGGSYSRDAEIYAP